MLASCCRSLYLTCGLDCVSFAICFVMSSLFSPRWVKSLSCPSNADVTPKLAARFAAVASDRRGGGRSEAESCR